MLARTAAATTISVLCGLIAAPAHAGANVNGTLSFEDGVVTYHANPGLANDLYLNWRNYGSFGEPPVFGGEDSYSFAITVDPSCGPTTGDELEIECEAGGATPVVAVYLGDGDDTGLSANEHAHGRTVSLFGEDGNDTLQGEGSTDLLDGGPGNDTLIPDGGVLDVSNGDVVRGGDGIDTVVLHDYASDGIRVTLDGVADDGEVNPDGSTLEGDNYAVDVENIVGARHTSNSIVGSVADNVITIDNTFGDTVDGAGGADTISTGDGNDTVLARDGVRDIIDCGAGWDKVVADDVDSVTNCEQVELPNPPVPEPTPGPEATPGGQASAGRKADANSSRRKATIRLRCSEDGPCAGTIVLSRGKAVVGRGRYELAAGVSRKVGVRLTRRARTELRQVRSAKVRVGFLSTTGTGTERKARLTR